MVSAKLIQELREKTGIGVMECKKALEESRGDIKKAEKILTKKGAAVALKKGSRETSQGVIESYIHSNSRVGVLLELSCETDFVAKNPLFSNLAHNLAMQIASMRPKDNKELLGQDFIKEPTQKIADLINQNIQQIGENIQIKRFVRYEMGEDGTTL